MKYFVCLTFFFYSILAFSLSRNRNPEVKVLAKKCQITLAGKSSYGKNNTVKVEEILADPVIRTSGCKDYTITSFEFLISVDGKSYTKTSTNDHLTNEMLDLIRKIKSGDPILIQSVHYKLPSGDTGEMPGITLRIQK